ncbi:MAG: hypothetical protein R2838_14365 [Caldilineaceae bacterium]
MRVLSMGGRVLKLWGRPKRDATWPVSMVMRWGMQTGHSTYACRNATPSAAI